MGRGRQKAKHTKVARDLKYYSPPTDLSALQRMVRFGDGDGLFDLFTKTRAIRRSIVAVGQETAAADFGRRDAGQTVPAAVSGPPAAEP